MLIRGTRLANYINEELYGYIGGMLVESTLFPYDPSSIRLDYIRKHSVLVVLNIEYINKAKEEYKIDGNNIELGKDLILCCKDYNEALPSNKTMWFLFIDLNKEHEFDDVKSILRKHFDYMIFTTNLAQIDEIASQSREREIEKIKEKYKADFEFYSQRIIEAEEHIRIYKERIEDFEKLKTQELERIGTKQFVSIIGQLRDIIGHKTVENFRYNLIKNCLEVTTNTLYMKHPYNDDRRLLGRMKIEINLDDYNPSFINLDNPRRSYWGEECNHPHVEQDGSACLGNLSAMLSDCHDKGELYAAYLMLIGFLQTFEPNDPAGEYYVCWDKVDSAGNIIEHGQDDKFECRCTSCGEAWSEDDMYFCEECQEYVCPDCVHTVEGNNLCNECYEAVVSRCTCCDEDFYVDSMFVDYRGNYICKDCKENTYIECAGCEQYVHTDEALYNEEDELYYCPDCHEAKREADYV